MTESMSARINKKSFFSSFFILLALMVFAGILTRVIPTGVFERVPQDGRQVIVPGSFRFINAAGLPVYKWFIAPIAVLFSPDGAAVIVIAMYIIFIGGTFSVLDKCGMLKHVIVKIVGKYKDNKYTLLRILVLAFMLFGSVFGVFEETVALAPICVALAYSFGWDALVGLGFSALATGFGFASATFNPFTLGIAQKLAELPTYSGTAFRVVIFTVNYIIFTAVLTGYAKKIERDPSQSLLYKDERKPAPVLAEYSDSPNLDRAVRIFLCFMGLIGAAIVAGVFIPPLSSILLPLTALIFLAAGISAGTASKYRGKLIRDLLKGMAGISPSIILILMAVSVKYIITEGNIMDSLLYYAQVYISSANPYIAVIFIYILVMILNFFVGSGSAKALLVMPIITGLSDLVGITRQTIVLAYCFGDGFSNMLYPTNPVLMIALSLTAISYGKWFRWVFKLQGAMFLTSLLFLFIGILIQYGPF